MRYIVQRRSDGFIWGSRGWSESLEDARLFSRLVDVRNCYGVCRDVDILCEPILPFPTHYSSPTYRDDRREWKKRIRRVRTAQFSAHFLVRPVSLHFTDSRAV